MTHTQNQVAGTGYQRNALAVGRRTRFLKHVYLLQAQHQIHLKTIHVTTQNNILDALSQGAIEEFLSNFPSINSQILIPLPDHLADKLVLL